MKKKNTKKNAVRSVNRTTMVAAVLVFTAIVVLGAMAWMTFGRGPATVPREKSAASRGQQRTTGTSSEAQPVGNEDKGSEATALDSARTAAAVQAAHERKVEMLTKTIKETLKRFKGGKVNADAARAMLDELDRLLRDAGGSAAGAAIVAFLASGEDAVTGLEFRVGEGGVLEEAPTLRTAMLDKLGQLSGKDATEYARNIFEQARNADEWAVNMRNLAWNNKDERFTPELQSRLEQMLDHKDWLQAPTAGFLEAFDLAVYLGGAQQVANMASVLGLGLQNGLDHAAFLSLDRLTLREPETVFNYLHADPNLMSWSPDVRAALMARATDSDSRVQREALEAYMQDPKTGTEEFHQFAELFPNRNYNLGSRLVTPEEQVTGLKEMAQADVKALEMVRQWMADSRFATRHAELGGVERRLVEYQKQIEEAKRDGSLK